MDCEQRRNYWLTQQCLAIVYDKQGHHADAAAALKTMQDENKDSAAYQYASIHAQWGDTAQALDWLETALRLRDGGLVQLRVDPLLDPIRSEPRFKAVLRQLQFPD